MLMLPQTPTISSGDPLLSEPQFSHLYKRSQGKQAVGAVVITTSLELPLKIQRPKAGGGPGETDT